RLPYGPRLTLRCVHMPIVAWVGDAVRAGRRFSMTNDQVLSHATVGSMTARLTDPLRPAQDPDEFVKELTAEVLNSAAANIGPFYERLIANRVSREGVQEWVKQWYIDSRMFPSVIGQIA